MKIAMLSSTFPPYAGGIGNVAAYNARALVKLGHEVTVFTPEYHRIEKEEFTDLKIVRLKPVIKYGNAALTFGFGRILKGFDIIHLHYPYFGGAELIWLQARRLKKLRAKFVLHYHMDVVGKGLFKTLFKIHNKIILPRIIKRSDKVIITSLDYGRHSNIAGLISRLPQKFVEVPNGVDSNNFTPQDPDSEFLKRRQIEPGEKVVLFVGGLDSAHYFKGVEYLIEAMSRLKQAAYKWRLVIVGDGDLKKRYSDLAGQLMIDYKTIFTGYVSNTDLPKYYNLADVVVLPSIDKSEAFGMALVEAMSCGKPVIATNLAGVRSVVADKINGYLVRIADADDLATKINYVLSNPELATQLGQAGREKVEERYDWDRIGAQLEEIYKSLRK